MGEKIVKIGVVADELGVTAKTIYNWIERGKIKMPRPGYVNYIDAWETYLQQKQDKSIFASTMARYGITRDENGRFLTRRERGE
jgi:predicted site-specific integrase-resolvase